jgi:putative heme-binding domain-containing protein
VWQVVAYLRSLNASQGNAGGDAEKGAALFRNKGCAQCHRLHGQGGRTGPDLTEIGMRRSSEHLRQALLEPNADVRQRYWVVTFTDGMGGRQEGFLMNEDTYTVQLLNAAGQLRTYEKSKVTNYKVEKISRMPTYKGQLGEGDVRDLVTYLASLRPERGTR